MNILSIIKEQQVKAQRRHDAELLMAKAYRGVAYTDVHHDQPSTETAMCIYRGKAYPC
tara:strand:+ start:353 stop:526 length:174 start_codon:yes stop_codon:yes gene_type:complete